MLKEHTACKQVAWKAIKNVKYPFFFRFCLTELTERSSLLTKWSSCAQFSLVFMNALHFSVLVVDENGFTVS